MRRVPARDGSRNEEARRAGTHHIESVLENGYRCRMSRRTATTAKAAGDGGSPRSLLFVPADRPERFATATASGADGVILDLEDAVADAAKVMARQHVAAWLVEHAATVRINASDTPWFDDDIAVVG